MMCPDLTRAVELREAEEAHLADIAEVRRALTTMIGEGGDQHYTGVYERAGGGYEGLQAIARAALVELHLLRPTVPSDQEAER